MVIEKIKIVGAILVLPAKGPFINYVVSKPAIFWEKSKFQQLS